MKSNSDWRSLRRTLVGPMPREDDSFPQPGEVRGALDMDLLNPEARLIVVVGAEETPTPWVQAVLVDTAGYAATPYDLHVTGSMSDIPFPFVVETDVTAPLLVSQLGPSIGVLREDVTEGIQGVMRDGIRPVDLWDKFGSPWVDDDPREAWKQRELQAMSDLSADAFQAVVEDGAVVFPDASAWEVLVGDIVGGVGADRIAALGRLASLSKFTIPAWMARSLAKLFSELRRDEREFLRPLMEQALRGPVLDDPSELLLLMQGGIGSEESAQTVDPYLAYVSERRPECRAFIRLGQKAGARRHRAVGIEGRTFVRRVQVSDWSVGELYGKAA